MDSVQVPILKTTTEEKQNQVQVPILKTTTKEKQKQREN